MSEKNLRDSETESSIFDGAGIYRREQVNEEETKEETKQKENNVFKVLLVTNAKIYQGKLEVKSDVISFNENEVVHERVYNDVCANNCERRSEVEIIKEELRFEVLVTEETLFVVKRYMLKDRALELYSENVSYFLCFCEG